MLCLLTNFIVCFIKILQRKDKQKWSINEQLKGNFMFDNNGQVVGPNSRKFTNF